MCEYVNLLFDDFADAWMGVADINGWDASSQIQVSLAGVIPEVLAVAFNNEEGLLVVRGVELGEVFLFVGYNLLVGGAGVGSGDVDGWRESGFGEGERDSSHRALELFWIMGQVLRAYIKIQV